MEVTKTRHGIDFISTKSMSRAEWLHNRQNGIGGSDIGTILGLNPYFSGLELFFQKINLNFKGSEDHTEPTYWGTVDEPGVLKTGEYYSFEDGSYLSGAGKSLEGDYSGRLRKINEFPYMCINHKYPRFIANLDGIVNLHNPTFKADCIAECKTISRQAKEKWEKMTQQELLDRLASIIEKITGLKMPKEYGGKFIHIPPYQFLQVHFYYVVLEPMLRKKKAMIFYKESGRNYYGYEIPILPELCEAIIEKANEFNKRVDAGKEIVKEYMSEPETMHMLLSQYIAPDDVEDTPAYSKFLSELFLNKEKEVVAKGDDEIFTYATEYNAAHKIAKEMEAKKQLANSQIKTWMYKNGCKKVTFDGKGQITFNQKLYVNTK